MYLVIIFWLFETEKYGVRLIFVFISRNILHLVLPWNKLLLDQVWHRLLNIRAAVSFFVIPWHSLLIDVLLGDPKVLVMLYDFRCIGSHGRILSAKVQRGSQILLHRLRGFSHKVFRWQCITILLKRCLSVWIFIASNIFIQVEVCTSSRHPKLLLGGIVVVLVVKLILLDIHL